jgi:H+-translocating NAD(P) transhydrogenase subunit beta
MNPSLAAILYLVSGVLFILALRGLSSPETSRQGNTYGMIGMAIAVVTTLLAVQLDVISIGIIVGATAIGGGIGAVLARRIAMTSMPQLVAAFHSLVGLAAVLIAGAAVYSPEAFHIAGFAGGIKGASLVEIGLGVAIGAITFTGSLIAFAKLNGNMSGAPIILPARHLLNIAIGVAIVGLIAFLVMTSGTQLWAFWALDIDHPYWGR